MMNEFFEESAFKKNAENGNWNSAVRESEIRAAEFIARRKAEKRRASIANAITLYTKRERAVRFIHWLLFPYDYEE